MHNLGRVQPNVQNVKYLNKGNLAHEKVIMYIIVFITYLHTINRR